MHTTASSLADLRDRYLDGYLALWPEEATTLGVHDHDHRLKDLSPEALEDELRFHEQAQASLQRLNAEELTADGRLDVLKMSVLSDFYLHELGEGQGRLHNMELSLYPYQLIQFHRRVAAGVGGWEAISSRVSQVPRYLAQQQALLQRGVQEGQTPDVDVVSFIGGNQIPHVQRFFETFAAQPAQVGVTLPPDVEEVFHRRCLAAAQAYAEHGAFLTEVVTPAASRRVLGEDEYAWRLNRVLGVEASPAEVIAQARELLAELCDELIAGVRAVHDGPIRSVQDALAFVMEQKKTPLTAGDDDIIAVYLAIHEKTKRHMREHDLFHFGDEVDELGFLPMPPAFAELGGAGTNIAAPLLDPAGRAFFLVNTNHEAHSRIQSVPFAVHEGIPGHGFQSIWWQTHRETRAHAVRFLGVPDEVVVAQQYYGAMMNIEGWATYVEVLMREHGLFTPLQTLWAIWCQMAHASRVVVEASLHTGRMSLEEGVSFLSEDAGWPRAWAEGELNRYLRIPLQSSCYLLGRLEILDLRERCRAHEGASFTLADFHERFFAAGPVAAGHLKEAWFRRR